MPEPLTDPRRARIRVGVGAALVVVLVAAGCAVFVAAISPSAGRTQTISTAPAGGDGADPVAASVYVHVLGSVARPGLYRLSGQARAVDAIAAAGGFTSGADRAAVNLARFVTDGEQLFVPEEGAADAPAAARADGRIDLNRADAAALDELPRVGPALAARIVQWREANGRFRSVDDLLAVTGIGEATLEGLRPLVTV